MTEILAGDRTRDQAPDLIIADYQLDEGQTGVAAVAELRKVFGATIPAAIISGYVTKDRAAEADELGVRIYSKPLKLEELKEICSAPNA